MFSRKPPCHFFRQALQSPFSKIAAKKRCFLQHDFQCTLKLLYLLSIWAVLFTSSKLVHIIPFDQVIQTCAGILMSTLYVRFAGDGVAFIYIGSSFRELCRCYLPYGKTVEHLCKLWEWDLLFAKAIQTWPCAFSFSLPLSLSLPLPVYFWQRWNQYQSLDQND